jgi:hypothetical protein
MRKRRHLFHKSNDENVFLFTKAPGHRGSVESTATVQSHLDAGLMSAITSHRRISMATVEAG